MDIVIADNARPPAEVIPPLSTPRCMDMPSIGHDVADGGAAAHGGVLVRNMAKGPLPV